VLQNQDPIRLDAIRLLDASSQGPTRPWSKAEKLEEWKRLPLQTTEQLVAWLQAQYRNSTSTEVLLSTHSEPVPGNDEARSTQEAAKGRPDRNAQPSRETPNNAVTPASVVERLKDCDMPIAPNIPQNVTDSARWRENYF
jgi:hypothetical protein